MLRSKKNRNKRMVVLLDSAVFLGAFCKGRSSTKLNYILKQACAFILASDLMAHLILAPSAENPSDVLSRGLRKKSKLQDEDQTFVQSSRESSIDLQAMGFLPPGVSARFAWHTSTLENSNNSSISTSSSGSD